MPINSEGIQIRYVSEGKEVYGFDNVNYELQGDTYIITNQENKGYAEIESLKPVHGICIQLDWELISEVIASERRPDTAYSDLELNEFLHSPLLMDQIKVSNSKIGNWLQNQSNFFRNPGYDSTHLNEETFYDIAELLISDQFQICKEFKGISSLKTITKRDLHKRVKRGKEYIDSYYRNDIKIEQIAKEACMSEFHFYRLFKSVFGISPHQYIIKSRLEFALNQIEMKQNTISEIAIYSGFSDIHSFSKSFKKHFGFNPSEMKILK